MAFTGAQYWAHQDQQRYQTPMHGRGLNPVVGDFHPNGCANGTELQRYSGVPPTPPTDLHQAFSGEMMQMRNYMLQTHFTQTRDVATMQRQVRQHEDEIQNMHQVVGNDVRALQSEIASLRQQFEAQNQAQNQQSGMIVRYSRADQDLTPPEEFIQNFSKQRIAEAYLEEAEDYEKAAYKLREQAKEICGEAVLALEGDETPTHRPARRATKDEGTKETSDAVGKDESGCEVVETTPKPEKLEPKGLASSGEATRAEDQAAILTITSPTSPEGQPWIPLAIRQMPTAESVATSNTETFTFDLLKSELGGEEWSPGFYFIKKSSNSKSQSLPVRSYWILESEFEPFLPKDPGHHGAKLTTFFNETGTADQAPGEDDYDNVPVFICNIAAGAKKGEYRYFGHYRQTRYSDKVDVDHLLSDIPEKVRRYHAEQLADTGRPAWVTECLKQHFWPRDEYVGPVPTDSAINTPATEAPASNYSATLEKRVMEALIDYANDLKEWEKEANLKVSLLTAESLMQAFSKADADEEPGLRLNLEYFQFLQYELGFYEYLVQLKLHPKKYERAAVAEGMKASLLQGKKQVGVGGKIVKPVNGVESLRPAPADKVRLSDKSAIPNEESELKWAEDKTESVKTAVNTGQRSFKEGVRPWEKAEKKAQEKAKAADGEKAEDGPSIANRNLEAAKVLQKEFKKGSGGGKEKAKVGSGATNSGPPHQRKK